MSILHQLLDKFNLEQVARETGIAVKDLVFLGSENKIKIYLYDERTQSEILLKASYLKEVHSKNSHIISTGDLYDFHSTYASSRPDYPSVNVDNFYIYKDDYSLLLPEIGLSTSFDKLFLDYGLNSSEAKRIFYAAYGLFKSRDNGSFGKKEVAEVSGVMTYKEYLSKFLVAYPKLRNIIIEKDNESYTMSESELSKYHL